MTLTLGQIKTQVRRAVEKARKKDRDPFRLGFYAPTGWNGPEHIEVDAIRWRIADVASPLAAREALVAAPATERLLLVCRVTEDGLGDDLMARVGVSQRLLRPDRLETLKDLFQAVSVDPRIMRHAECVDVLTEHVRDQAVSPAANGHLTAEHFWGQLLSLVWGLPTGPVDLVDILRWTLIPGAADVFRASSQEFRDAASTWLQSSACGPAVNEILRSFQEIGHPSPVVLGLACEVLFDTRVFAETQVAQARVRIERYLGHRPLAREHAQAWADAANTVMGTVAATNDAHARMLSRELDDLLTAIQAADFAFASPWSDLGFDSSIGRLGADLQRFMAAPGREVIRKLFGAIDELRSRRLTDPHRDRIDRAEMAVRLASWLQTSNGRPAAELPSSLPKAVEFYLNDESFVDWARTSLRTGDPAPAMAKAMRQLLEAVTPLRARFNESFAGLLSAWSPGPGGAGGIVPIHKVLSDVVAPIGGVSPVLIIVLDGMSAAVFDELMSDLAASGWRSISHRHAPRPLILAGTPSVTELSRTSLLSGTLQTGGQPEELAGFTEHPALRQVSRGGSPKLFHKGNLTFAIDGNLSMEVGEAISSSSTFVAVVINAIDDHLAKGEQLNMDWTADRIRPLPTLLARARDAGRTVILVSDHGHLIDQGTKETTSSDSDRYRSATPAPADGEVLLYPARTGLGVASGGVVAIWSESLRYSRAKNGYHGGASPQEMVVPLAILRHSGPLPDGCTELQLNPPSWWNGESEVASPVVAPAKASASPSLFDPPVAVPASPAVASHPAPAPAPAWVQTLVESELFKAQLSRAGRSVPSPLEVAKFIAIMVARGGKLTRPALARAVNMPELRIGGYVSQLRRILNVDGYPIVNVHEESSTVELNEALLKAQFDLT